MAGFANMKAEDKLKYFEYLVLNNLIELAIKIPNELRERGADYAETCVVRYNLMDPSVSPYEEQRDIIRKLFREQFIRYFANSTDTYNVNPDDLPDFDKRMHFCLGFSYQQITARRDSVYHELVSSKVIPDNSKQPSCEISHHSVGVLTLDGNKRLLYDGQELTRNYAKRHRIILSVLLQHTGVYLPLDELACRYEKINDPSRFNIDTSDLIESEMENVASYISEINVLFRADKKKLHIAYDKYTSLDIGSYALVAGIRVRATKPKDKPRGRKKRK